MADKERRLVALALRLAAAIWKADAESSQHPRLVEQFKTQVKDALDLAGIIEP